MTEYTEIIKGAKKAYGYDPSIEELFSYELYLQAQESKTDSIDKEENSITSHDIPDLYDGTGVDPSETGIVLIKTEKIPVLQYIKDGEDDVYYGDEEDSHFGVPAEEEPHVTLLQGFLENANNWKDKVDKCLEGWEMPTVTIKEVSYFERDDYVAIVGLVKKTDELIDGHERLTLLPHISEFSEYLPHITFAYIKKGTSTNKWIKPLAKKYNGQKVAVKGLDYGDKPTKKVKKKNSLDKESSLDTVYSNVEASHSHDCSEHANDINSTLEKAKNALNPEIQKAVVMQESDLYTSTQGLEADITNAFILVVRNGDYDKAEDILSEKEERSFTDQLKLMLAAYYLVLMPIYAKQLLDTRLVEYNQQGIFAMTDEIKEYIEFSSSNAAQSHVNTVKKDLIKAVNVAEGKAVKDSMYDIIRQSVDAREDKYLKKLPLNPNNEDIKSAINKGVFDTDKDLYKRARELARQGEGLEGITRAIRNEYQNISVNRAKTIARHETNRVFNMAQYQADVQFLTESNLMDSAYKILRNRADDPCPICAKIVEETRENPIPFQKNFVDLGQTISAQYKKENGKPAVQTMKVNYEAIKAGNVHVNCRCEYVLVIKQEDGTFLNSLDVRVDNSRGYNPYRDSEGKFASGPGSFHVVGDSIASTEALKKTYKVEESAIDEHQEAISNYAGGGFDEVNRALRKGYKKESMGDSWEADTIYSMDDAFKNKVQVLKKKTTVYRGIRSSQEFTKGGVIENKGFTSTSLETGIPRTFARPREGGENGYLMKVTMPKGTPVIVPSSYGVGSPLEVEMIFDRGSKFQVKSIKTEDITGLKLVEATYVQ